MYKGKLIRLKVNDEYIPCELSCEITVNQETLQVTNTVQGRAKSFIRGYYDWTVTVNGRLNVRVGAGASQSLLGYILEDGNGIVQLEIISNDPNGAPFVLTGEALVTSWNMNAGGTDWASNTTVFQGSGELTQDYDLYWIIINQMPITAEKDIIIDTTEW